MTKKIAMIVQAMLLAMFVQGCWAEKAVDAGNDSLELAGYESHEFNACVIHGRRCFDGTEQEIIEINKDRVNRIRNDKEDILQIKSLSGNINFRSEIPNKYGEQDFSYRYLGYISEIGYHLIAHYRYSGESLKYILVSESSGKKFEMYGPPYLSPDQKRLVAIRASEGEDKDEIVVWKITKEELIEEYRYQPETYALYKFIDWKSPDTIKLGSYRDSGKERCKNGGRLKAIEILEKSVSKWELRIDTILSVECHQIGASLK